MKSAEHGAVDRVESCQYNKNAAKQRVKKGILVNRELRFRASAPGGMGKPSAWTKMTAGDSFSPFEEHQLG
ncbi:MAG: hypothetical protein DMG50_25770 [Acidobacteria bacterium]|nr:MAG: hypothetical protein DMG50_25770 [Acidobacteriota bacterium]